MATTSLPSSLSSVQSPITKLDKDMMGSALSFLPIKEIATAREVNRFFYKSTQNNSVFQGRYSSISDQEFPSLDEKLISFKEIRLALRIVKSMGISVTDLSLSRRSIRCVKEVESYYNWLTCEAAEGKEFKSELLDIVTRHPYLKTLTLVRCWKNRVDQIKEFALSEFPDIQILSKDELAELSDKDITESMKSYEQPAMRHIESFSYEEQELIIKQAEKQVKTGGSTSKEITQMLARIEKLKKLTPEQLEALGLDPADRSGSSFTIPETLRSPTWTSLILRLCNDEHHKKNAPLLKKRILDAAKLP